MKKSTLFILLVAIIGAVAIAATGVVLTMLRKRAADDVAAKSSDQKMLATQLRVAGDPWLGYATLRSPKFRQFLEAEGIGLQYTDDGANYAERMQKFAAGDYDLIVTTLDAYLLNAKSTDYPGVIIFAIDESQGGDAVIAKKEVAAIADLAKPGRKIALTPNSPSDFLLRSIAAHFDLVPLKVAGEWRVATDGSAGALRALNAGEVDAAVLWEPEVTQALANPKFHRLLGTEKTKGLIVDVCVASRNLVVEKPEVVQKFVDSWFQALRFYQSDEKELLALAAKDANVTNDKATAMLAGVRLLTLVQNCHEWFGVGPEEIVRESILDSITGNSEVLVETRQFDTDPLDGAPRKIINSTFLTAAYSKGSGQGVTSQIFQTPGAGDEAAATPIPTINFPPLDDAGWAKLNILGKLKIRPIYFQDGNALLTLEGKKGIDRIADDLLHYPRFRLLLKGHTKTEGDGDENRRLSLQRAQAVADYLVRIHEFQAPRIHVEGLGGDEPLPRDEGESPRRWQGRLPRVEVLLVEDPSI